MLKKKKSVNLLSEEKWAKAIHKLKFGSFEQVIVQMFKTMDNVNLMIFFNNLIQ